MTDEDNKAESPLFSLAIDDLIIDGFFTNQAVMFRKLKAMGFRMEDVIERTKQLGLSVQFLKRCSIGNVDVALRGCLRCSERFLSAGFQNRLCNRCKSRK